MSADIPLQNFRQYHAESPDVSPPRPPYSRPEDRDGHDKPEEEQEDREIQHLLEHIEHDEVPKAKWSSLFAFTTWKHSVVLGGALFLSLVSGLILPAMSILLGRIFGEFAEVGSKEITLEEFMSRTRVHALHVAILGLVGWALNSGFFSAWIYFGELQAKTVRVKMFEGMIFKELDWYENRKNGLQALMSKCQTLVSHSSQGPRANDRGIDK